MSEYGACRRNSIHCTTGEHDANELVAEMDAATNENVVPIPNNAAMKIMDEYSPDKRPGRIDKPIEKGLSSEGLYWSQS
jgi:hypothetical protein